MLFSGFLNKLRHISMCSMYNVHGVSKINVSKSESSNIKHGPFVSNIKYEIDVIGVSAEHMRLKILRKQITLNEII